MEKAITITPTNDIKETKEAVTVSVRNMDKAVWYEAVIQAKRMEIPVHVFMKNMILDELERLDVNVSHLR